MTQAEQNELVKAFAGGYQRLIATLVKCPRSMWGFKPAPGEWSIQEIIVHLADCEAHFYVRVRHGIAEPGHIVSSLDQDAWTKELNYAAQNADEALDFIRIGRKFTADLLARLPEGAWQRSFEHPERGTITVEGITRQYVAHDETHMKQIARVAAAWQAQQQQAQ